MLIITAEQQNRWAESASEVFSRPKTISASEFNKMYGSEHFDFKHNPEGAQKYRVKQKSGMSTVC